MIRLKFEGFFCKKTAARPIWAVPIERPRKAGDVARCPAAVWAQDSYRKMVKRYKQRLVVGNVIIHVDGKCGGSYGNLQSLVCKEPFVQQDSFGCDRTRKI